MAEVSCAHPGCDCTLTTDRPFGKYCSEYCREHGKMTELACHCGHQACGQEQGVHAKPPEASTARPVSH
jgi:hypothetical protein